MTAETLTIGHFHARYRLSRSAAGEQERLDAALEATLSRAAEPALAAAGLAGDEIICLRSVSVPVRLRLSATDEALVTTWSDALAGAIADALARGGSDAVRYDSRAQALVDLVLGVARGDLERAWAWRQLGLWRAPAGMGDAERAEVCARSLAQEPESIVAVLATVAAHGALPALLVNLPGAATTALADAALAAAGPLRLADLALDGRETPARAHAAAVRIVRSSRIAAAAAGALPAVLDPELRRALAALAVLESDPGAVSGSQSDVAALVAAVSRVLRPTFGPPRPQRETNGSRKQDARSTTAGDAPGRDVRQPTDVPRTNDEAVDRHDSSPEPESEDAATPSAADSPLLVDVRLQASTGAGGLLYLVGLVEQLGLQRRLQSEPALAARTLRWSLHRLGCLLAGIAEGDPAALAFAGLSLDSAPPSQDEAPAEEPELAVLGEAAEQIADELRVQLARVEEPTAEVLRWVIERRAELITDPGWIEARFSLDDVSTDLRRVGLDLDPGWVPWLGVVLRFVYE